MTCGCKKKPKMGGVKMGAMTIDEATDFLAKGEVFKFSEPEYVGKYVVRDPMNVCPRQEVDHVEPLPIPPPMKVVTHANVNGIKKLERGRVWCVKCGRSQDVDSAVCFQNGWPTCCGETMTIDSPEERNG